MGKVWILSMSVSKKKVEEGQAEDKDIKVARAPAWALDPRPYALIKWRGGDLGGVP